MYLFKRDYIFVKFWLRNLMFLERDERKKNEKFSFKEAFFFFFKQSVFCFGNGINNFYLLQITAKWGEEKYNETLLGM